MKSVRFIVFIIKSVMLTMPFIAFGLQSTAQSAKTEYVPINLNWSDDSKLIPTEVKVLDVTPYNNLYHSRNSNMGQTFTFTKAEICDKNDKSSKSYKFESTVNIKNDVIDAFLNDRYFQTKIVTRFWKDNTLILKTLLSDNTTVTYQKLPGDKELIIEFPEMIIVLGN